MPHITVKLWPGKSEQQKTLLCDAIVSAFTSTLNYDKDAISVTFQEVSPDDWKEQVYAPDIINTPGKLYKKPGYTL